MDKYFAQFFHFPFLKIVELLTSKSAILFSAKFKIKIRENVDNYLVYLDEKHRKDCESRVREMKQQDPVSLYFQFSHKFQFCTVGYPNFLLLENVSLFHVRMLEERRRQTEC